MSIFRRPSICLLAALCVPLLLPFTSGAQTFSAATDTGNPYLSEKEREKRDLADKLEVLQANRIQEIYVAKGYVTTLKFDGKHPIEGVTFGSDIIEPIIDKARPNIIYIHPLVSEGQTNMFVTINGMPYAFVVHIVADDRVMYRKTFTQPDSIPMTDNSLPAVRGPSLKPQDIDVVFYISAIERSEKDPTYFRSMRGAMQTISLNKVYTWNGCPITLIEAVQFPKDNLTVLKIQWQNLTDRALYLSASQYQVYVANQFFPVTAKSQLSELLFPGQMDTTYLFLQGMGLSADNAFELALPPEAAGVRRLID